VAGVVTPPRREAFQDLRDRLREHRQLRDADGKLIMFRAIERASKFTYVEFYRKAGKMVGLAFQDRGGFPLTAGRFGNSN
jgi:hypothetical protein